MQFGKSRLLSTAGSPASVRRFVTVSKIMPVIGSPCLGDVGFLFSSEIPPIYEKRDAHDHSLQVYARLTEHFRTAPTRDLLNAVEEERREIEERCPERLRIKMPCEHVSPSQDC